MNDIERIVAIDVLEKLADREIGIRKGHSKILKEVIKDIEKQIPKKPSNISHPQHSEKIGTCPLCGQWNNVYKKHCIECGQKLDWRAEE